MIPTLAIIPQASDKFVYLVKNGAATYVKIQTGLRREADVEVISGILPGDTVVTAGVMFLKPSMPVKLSKVN